MKNIKIVVCGRNLQDYIGRCLESIITQDKQNWECVVMLDPPTDSTLEVIKPYISEDARIRLYVNTKVRLLMLNTLLGIERSEPKPNDVITLIDGDDSLYDRKVLSCVDYVYSKTNCLLTYGSMVTESAGVRLVTKAGYSPNDNVRETRWRASHLKTFKYKLWSRVPVQYFKGEDGNWLTTTSDMAMMMSMIELAGIENTRYVSRINYLYNNLNPLCVRSNIKDVQVANEHWIRSMEPLNRVF